MEQVRRRSPAAPGSRRRDLPAGRSRPGYRCPVHGSEPPGNWRAARPGWSARTSSRPRRTGPVNSCSGSMHVPGGGQQDVEADPPVALAGEAFANKMRWASLARPAGKADPTAMRAMSGVGFELVILSRSTCCCRRTCSRVRSGMGSTTSCRRVGLQVRGFTSRPAPACVCRPSLPSASSQLDRAVGGSVSSEPDLARLASRPGGARSAGRRRRRAGATPRRQGLPLSSLAFWAGRRGTRATVRSSWSLTSAAAGQVVAGGSNHGTRAANSARWKRLTARRAAQAEFGVQVQQRCPSQTTRSFRPTGRTRSRVSGPGRRRKWKGPAGGFGGKGQGLPAGRAGPLDQVAGGRVDPARRTGLVGGGLGLDHRMQVGGVGVQAGGVGDQVVEAAFVAAEAGPLVERATAGLCPGSGGRGSIRRLPGGPVVSRALKIFPPRFRGNRRSASLVEPSRIPPKSRRDPGRGAAGERCRLSSCSKQFEITSRGAVASRRPFDEKARVSPLTPRPPSTEISAVLKRLRLRITPF